MLRNHEPSGGLARKPPGYVTVGALGRRRHVAVIRLSLFAI